MRDPFPLQSPPIITQLSSTIAHATGLYTLPLHLHEVLFSALFYTVIQVVVSPAISRRLFPKRYPALSSRTRLNWDVHVVSLTQSIAINAVALYIFTSDLRTSERPTDYRERIWGYNGGNGLIQSLAAGYFLWDLYVSLRYVSIFGLGLLAHAVAALSVYTLGYRPFTGPYAPIFILYELSSPFLNVHWFCDKLDLTGSSLQFYNGLLLILTFFGSRLVWGLYHSVVVFSDIWKCYTFQSTAEGKTWMAGTNLVAGMGFGLGVGDEGVVRPTEIPWWLAATYLGSNITLTALNVFWFGKMIETIRSRFEPPLGTKGTGPKRHVKGKEVEIKKEAGRGSVSIESVQHAKRPGSSGGPRTRRRG